MKCIVYIIIQERMAIVLKTYKFELLAHTWQDSRMPYLCPTVKHSLGPLWHSTIKTLNFQVLMGSRLTLTCLSFHCWGVTTKTLAATAFTDVRFIRNKLLNTLVIFLYNSLGK